MKKGEKVVALYRDEAKKANVLNVFKYYSTEAKELYDKIKWKQAELADFSSLEDAFEGVQNVYHCAAYVSFKNKNWHKFEQSNIKGTENIVNLCLDKKIRKLVHVSSIATLATSTEGLTDEEMVLDINDTKTFYSKSKYYAELEVFRGIEEGLNAVIVNPSVILAPYSLSKLSGKIIKYLLKNGIKYFVCGKKGYVDVNDVAATMILLMQSDICSDKFILNSENLSFKKFFEIVNEKIDKKPPKVRITKRKLEVIKFLLNIITFGNSFINNQLIYYAINDELYSNNKIVNAIDYQFKPISQTIEEILNIYRKIL